MPNFLLSDEDARDISAFLIANSTPEPGDTATLQPVIRERRSYRGREPLWRIVLRILPCDAERRGQSGGRRSGTGADGGRNQGQTGMADGVAA